MSTNTTTRISSRFSFSSIRRAIRAGINAVRRAIGAACTAVAGVVRAGYDFVAGAVSTAYTTCEKAIAETGIHLPTVCYGAAAVATVAGTAALFITGLPAIVVPLTGIAMLAWLTSDVISFCRGYGTVEEQMEAIARTSVCLFVGTLAMAAIQSNPILGGMIVGCLVAGMLFRLVGGDAGRFAIVSKYAHP
jgi:hypothetical protein